MLMEYRTGLGQRLEMRTSLAVEWAWMAGRLALVAMVALGGSLFLAGRPGFTHLAFLLAAVLAYQPVIAYLLKRERLGTAFRLGFALDNLAVLTGWWIISSAGASAAPAPSNDLYLVLFSVIIIGVVRLGPLWGIAYFGFWAGWMTWATHHFYGPGSYAAEQLPVRIFALAIATGLVMWLISQRNQAREVGQAVSNQYEALFTTMRDAVFIASQEGELVNVNQAAADLLRSSPEDLRGMRIESLFSPQDRARFAEAFQRALDGEAVTQELVLRSATGEEASVEVRASTAGLGEQVVWIGVGRDLTDRKEMEQRLLRSERLRVLGQMASGITHDVHNALTPIIGYSDLLANSPKHRSDEKYLLKTLNVIQTAAQDAAAVVGRLRDFYRERQPEEDLSPIDLNEIALHVSQLAEIRRAERTMAIGGRIELRCERAPEPVTAQGHVEDMRQALLNLVLNAMDAMTKPGAVVISVARSGDWGVLRVTDTGEGMDPEVLAHCTEPFFSTKGDGGTGLGLAMVFGCARRHNGTLDIQSEPGKGTTVSIFLPLEGAQPSGPKLFPAAMSR